MAQQVKYLLFILVIAAFSGCQKYKNRVSEEHQLDGFHTLILDDSFEVELVESDGYKVTIEAAEKYIDQIKWEITDSTITFTNESKRKWMHPAHNKIKLRISCPSLKLIKAFESCSVKTIEPITTYEFGIIVGGKLNMADLEFNNSVVYCWNYFPCGGTLKFSGNTNTVKVWSTAILTVDSRNLNANDAYIVHNGKNDLFLYANQLFNYSIQGNGNLNVYGNPGQVQEVDKSGNGELILH